MLFKSMTAASTLFCAWLFVACTSMAVQEVVEVSYLDTVIEPCVPVDGTDTDPCAPVESFPLVESAGLGSEVHGDVPPTLKEAMWDPRLAEDAVHIVVRATYLPGTTRCSTRLFVPFPHLVEEYEDPSSVRYLLCFIDARVNEYIVGRGSPRLSVMIGGLGLNIHDYPSNEQYLSAVEVYAAQLADQYDSVYSGVERVVLLSPSWTLSTEAWVVSGSFWDVQRNAAGEVITIPSYIHAFPNEGRMSLVDFAGEVQRVHRTVVSEAESIASGQSERVMPLFITDTHDLKSYYSHFGAYDNSVATPAPPPTVTGGVPHTPTPTPEPPDDGGAVGGIDTPTPTPSPTPTPTPTPVPSDEGGASGAVETPTQTPTPTPEPPPAQATSCSTDVGALTASSEWSGAWDDAECRAHHRADSPARYFTFTLAAETTVSITLTSQSEAAALFVSTGGDPNSGWGAAPQGTYANRIQTRLTNGKLLHNATPAATLTLTAGTHTIETAGPSDTTFALTISPSFQQP